MMSSSRSIAADRASGDGDFQAILSDDGVLDIVIREVWTVDQVERFFNAILPLHHQSRARHGRVRALIRVSTVQSPSVALHVRERAVAIKRDEDRNAVVVASFLSKLQITRLASGKNFGLFTDATAARNWLLEP